MIDDEKLIELVRQYPELYDINHKKYLDTAFKIKIWTSIGVDMKSDGEYYVIFIFILTIRFFTDIYKIL